MAAPVSDSSLKSLAEKNREWFDNAIQKNAFDIPWIKELTDFISSKLRNNFDWIGVPKTENGIKLLDYACGNGIVSRAVEPFIAQAIGIDLSPKMVEAYIIISESNHHSNMYAIEGDLLSPSASLQDPKYFNFDLIVMSMALHHVSDTQLMINKLHDRLTEGGVLVIVDWLTMGIGGTEHVEGWKLPASHTVGHYGFSVEEMRILFERAGMGDVGFMEGIERSNVPAEMKYEQQMFIAKARKV